MADDDLRFLEQATANTAHPLDDPPREALDFIASLDLSDSDLELLLGDAPGLSWSDAREHTLAFFVRLRTRIGRIVCDDSELKDEVRQSCERGSEAIWISLIAGLGFSPEGAVALALKPLAVGVMVSGVEGLCKA